MNYIETAMTSQASSPPQGSQIQASLTVTKPKINQRTVGASPREHAGTAGRAAGLPIRAYASWRPRRAHSQARMFAMERLGSDASRNSVMIGCVARLKSSQ